MSSDSESYTSKHEDSLRKVNKPLMEKKRRARINHCLAQLKTLVLEAMKRDSAQVSKLEKADILEMTVNYLRNTQHRQQCVDSTSDMRRNKYKTGFNECATEVMRYLSNDESASHDVKARLSDHLTRCVRVMNSKVSGPGTDGYESTSRTSEETLSIDIPTSTSNCGSEQTQSINGVYLLKTQNINSEISYQCQQSFNTNGQRLYSQYKSQFQINMDNSVLDQSRAISGQGHSVTSGHRHTQHFGYTSGFISTGSRPTHTSDSLDHINNNDSVWRPW